METRVSLHGNRTCESHTKDYVHSEQLKQYITEYGTTAETHRRKKYISRVIYIL